MLRRLGVDVVRGVALQTVFPRESDTVLRAQVAGWVTDPPDFFVANTGIGVRTLFERAEEWGLADDLRRCLGGVVVLARGPKAVGALRLAGVAPAWRAPTEQLAEVTEHLLGLGVAGARVVFQLHGDRNEGLAEALRHAGAVVTEIEVYRWEVPADGGGAVALVEACCAGEIDAVTFTAAPAVRRLFDVAEAAGRAEDLAGVLDREVVVACVGPVCAAAAQAEGLTSPVVPEHWRLGSLVRLVGECLAERRRVLQVAGTTQVVVQGSLLQVGGREVRLDAEERGVARLLSEHPGDTVPAASLAARLWRAGEPAVGQAALAGALARLRAKLGPAGAAITSPAPGALRWDAALR